MNRLNITPGFVLLLSILFYVCPGWFFGAFLLCCTVHELCHWAALWLWDIKITGLKLEASGAVMHTAPMSFSQECFCALAGPFGNLLIFWLFWKLCPRLALVSLLLALYNLLPIYPLDGGRALRAVLGMLLPEPACRWTEWVIGAAVLLGIGVGMLKTEFGYGLFPLLLFRVLCLLPTQGFQAIIKRKHT